MQDASPGPGGTDLGTSGAGLRSLAEELRSDCEALFLQLRAATEEEALPLRRELARAHAALDVTLERMAALPWDGDPWRSGLDEAERCLAEMTRAGIVELGPLTEARAALAAGDAERAEAVLAGIAAATSGPAGFAAKLAHARGLLAELALLWPLAAEQYALAARLDPDLRHLGKARAAACRTGDLTAAFRFGKGMLVLAETEGSAADQALAMADHALTLEAQDRLAEAEGFLRKAVVGGRRAEGVRGADHARHLAQLARVLEAQDRLPEAEAALRKALEVTRTAPGEAHPDYCARLNALAGLLRAQDRDSEAEPLHLRALDLAQRLPGGRHPVAIACLTGLAELREGQGRLDEAEALYRRALHLDQDLAGRTHPDFAGRICALAEVVRAARRLPEAERLFRLALEVDRATIGATHRDYGVGLNNLAGVVEAQGRPEEAETLYAQALAILRETLGDLHPATQKVVRNFRALILSALPGSVHRPGLESLWATAQATAPGLSLRQGLEPRRVD
ncbi:tetratricopeptide repeat protein [Rhodobacter calidifons]|uniref:Tetratricopeptide repeat protein n=1 Tax=Rhodobacter calidifons TaxID=2715277 RepID=A0ABX0G8G8_9RHOB|nr:tetratricopeptide repeat protein [Rhodobacter calidifons]NHB77142.1 tetratricopeptide repeat protein [Rhodobacter calidifons]